MAYHGSLFPLTWLVSGSVALVSVGSLFLPVFYKMRLTSVYEVSDRGNYSRAMGLDGASQCIKLTCTFQLLGSHLMI